MRISQDLTRSIDMIRPRCSDVVGVAKVANN